MLAIDDCCEFHFFITQIGRGEDAQTIFIIDGVSLDNFEYWLGQCCEFIDLGHAMLSKFNQSKKGQRS